MLIDTRLIKAQIRDAAMALAETVMSLVEADCRRVIRLVVSRYEALLARCQEQPKVRLGCQCGSATAHRCLKLVPGGRGR